MTAEIMESLYVELKRLSYEVEASHGILAPTPKNPCSEIWLQPPTIDVRKNGKSLVLAATQLGVEVITENQSLDDDNEFELAAPDSLVKLLREIERLL